MALKVERGFKMFEKVGKGLRFLEVARGFIDHCLKQLSINLKLLATFSNFFQLFPTFFYQRVL